MLFNPSFFHYPFIAVLLPFSLLYYPFALLKLKRKKKTPPIPVVSVGNIIIGGSGKTPVVIEIAKKFKDFKPAVVLRGYGRKTRGLLVVKDSKINCDVHSSGDEAMEIATNCDAVVIVSEKREEGILKAHELGCGFVILDDGFDKPFKKLNIVIDEKIKNPFLLPAGGYRYPRSALKYADVVLKEGENFKRRVKIPEGDVLVSAISKPRRLLKYFKGEYLFFPDHYDYKIEDLACVKDKKIITTKKDFVKLKDFGLNLGVMELQIELNEEVLEKIENYLIKLQQKGY